MKNKKIVIGILTLVFLLVMQNFIFAASFKFEAIPNKTEVQQGDTVELTFVISEINIGTAGMNAIEAQLEYDTSIFEEVKSDNIQGLNEWTYKYNPKNKKLLGYIYSMGVDVKEEIFKISFKVKDKSKLTETEIKINNITTNDGEKLITTDNQSKKIKIVKKSNNDNGNGSNSSSGVNESDPNLANRRLPQTGQRILIFGAIAITTAIAIFAKIKSSKKWGK